MLDRALEFYGIMYAKLFTLHIDGLITELNQTGYGCHINNTYMGALSYADDQGVFKGGGG